MFGIGFPELIVKVVIMGIVLVVFGAGRLPEVGSALGRRIRGFKKDFEGGVADDLKTMETQPEPPHA